MQTRKKAKLEIKSTKLSIDKQGSELMATQIDKQGFGANDKWKDRVFS